MKEKRIKWTNTRVIFDLTSCPLEEDYYLDLFSKIKYKKILLCEKPSCLANVKSINFKQKEFTYRRILQMDYSW